MWKVPKEHESKILEHIKTGLNVLNKELDRVRLELTVMKCESFFMDARV